MEPRAFGLDFWVHVYSLYCLVKSVMYLQSVALPQGRLNTPSPTIPKMVTDPHQFTKRNAFTRKVYRDVYPAVDPRSPALSQAGKVVMITGA
jgi:hypothetical protein